MKIGMTGGSNSLPLALRHHLDYCEDDFFQLASMNEEDMVKKIRKYGEAGLAGETVNHFFDRDFALYEGGDEKLAFLRDYVERGMKNAKRIGCEVAVVGSGSARRLTENMTLEQAEKRFAEVMDMCGDIAGKYGIKLVIEPLRYEECNFINTVAEEFSMKNRIGNPHIGSFVDFFHFYMNGEALDTIDPLGPDLIHTHLARPNPDRDLVKPGDEAVCGQWADKLRQLGYHGRMTIEANIRGDIDEAFDIADPILDLFRAV